jgi:TolA-binding protein
MHSSPLGPRSTSDVGTQVAAEMRLQAPTDERAAPAGPKVAQRAGAREGVMSAPGDPSYEWWIGRFPLLDEDWKRMPGAEAASAGDALHSVNAGNEGLRDEGSRLDAVRMLLERSQATDALESLDAYRDRWPRGAMSADAMVLRVRALLELGRFDEAEQQAQVLESFAPNSQYARDARVLMATQKKARHP